MNEELKKYYEYLKSVKADIPDTFESFAETLADETQARTYFDYLKANKFDTPDTFESFSDTFQLKKKDLAFPYLESLAKNQAPATKALEDFWKEQEKPTEVQPPLQLGKKPIVKREEILAEKPDITSVLKAQQKLPDYFRQEQEKLITDIEENITGELAKLTENYKKKITDNPEKERALQEEYKTEFNKMVELRTASIPSAIESLYKRGKDYQYLDPTDVKELATQAREIVSKPMDYIQKRDAIESLRVNILSQVGDIPPEALGGLKREINDVIAQNSLLDEKGNPTVFGWKQEVLSKKEQVRPIVEQMLKENPDLANIATDYKIRTSDVGKKYQALINTNELYDRVLALPDDGGSFWDGMKSQGRNILTMGMDDLFEAIDIKKVMDKQRKGEQVTTQDQALIDAYGITQVAQSADEFSKAYETGQTIGGSVAWMEQFALTSGLGSIGAKSAMKLLGQNVKNKVVQNIVKGFGSAVARTPVLVGGYTEAISRMAGRPKMDEQGQWKLDPSTIEPVAKAIGKGLYSNLAEAFGETAGGWFAGSKFNKIIGKSLGLTKISKGVSKIFNTIGMQPLGELGEEYLTTLMTTPVMGDQSLKEAFSGENVWDTAVSVGLMSGFFGGLAAPSVLSVNVRRGRAMDMIKIFGKDNISNIRTAIETNDKEAFADALRKSFEGKTIEDLGMSVEKAQKELIKYTNYLAQVRGRDAAQEAVNEEAQANLPEEIKTNITEPSIGDMQGTQKGRIHISPTETGIQLNDPTQEGMTEINTVEDAIAVKDKANADKETIDNELTKRREAKVTNSPFRILGTVYNTKEEFIQGLRDSFGGQVFDAELLMSDDIVAEGVSLVEISNIIDEVTEHGDTKRTPPIELRSTGELSALKPFYDARIRIADNTQKYLGIETKTEEETKDAERIREEAKGTGEQAQELVEGDEGGLYLWNAEKNRLETKSGEEIVPQIGDVITVQGKMGTWEITGFKEDGTVIMRPLENVVDSETRYYIRPQDITKIVSKAKQESMVITEEEVKPLREGNIFNKQQVIESLLTEVPEETKDMMRTEFAQLERDEFNKMAEQAGFNNFGSYWTRETIAKESIKPTEKPREAISEKWAITPEMTEEKRLYGEIPEGEGIVPPPPGKPVETPEKAPKGQKRAGFEKRETARGTRGSIEMRKDEIGKIVKRIIDDNPHFYKQTHRTEEIEKAKEFISSFASFDNVYSNLVKKTKNIDELTMRHVARQVMLQKLGEDLRDAMKTGDKELSNAISDKIVNLDDITQKEVRISSTTMAMTLWQFMPPEATVFMVNKVINEANKTKLGFEAKQAEEFIGEWGKEAPESIKRLIKENPELRDFIEKIRAKAGKVPPTHRVTKAKAKEIANKVRSLKSSNWGIAFADPIGAVAILDGALEVTAKTIETTGNLLQAIQDGINEIKKSGWYKSLTNQKQKEIEKTFGNKVRENIDFDAAEYIEGQSWYKEAEKPITPEEEKVQKKEERKAIAKADKKLREQIFDVIASHWLVEKTSDKTLVDKLVEEVGLTKREAEKIANISEEAVKRDSQRVFESTLGKKIINTNTRKSAFEKFFNLIKRGVLTNENYYEVFAEKYKLKAGLTEEEKITIQKLAVNAQQMAPYGYYGDLAFNEFLQYMAKVSEQDSWLERQGKLMVAVNYASILMGVTTHKVNLTSAGANLLIRPFLGTANPVKWADVGIKLMQGKVKEAHLKNPLAALCYASQAYRIGGIIGGTTALNIIKHGNIKESSKYMEAVNNLSGQEIPELEKSTFGVGKRFRPWDKFRFKVGNKTFLGDLNPWNAFKYSGRTLLAEDAAMFNEPFALELALAARREAIMGNTALSPSQLRKKILNEIAGMYLTEEQTQAVEQQLEEQTQMLRMAGTEPTPLQIKQRRFELTRSLLELKPEMEEELTQLSRGEIFTGKRGGIFSIIGDALGGLFSKHILIKLGTLPKIPFTGVLGRIADYSVDTMPGYGTVRAEGWSPTGIIARMRQWNRSGQFSDFMTAPAKYGMFKSAQMGARGTPAHERQMARHYFGLVLLTGAAAVFLRDDDDIEKDKDGHPIIDITGGLHYNTWDEKEHHYLGAYTVRLKGWKFRFLNFPILNAPLAIIGNYKDAVRAGEDNDDLWARLSLLGAAWYRSLGLIKDTWLAKGINDLFELTGGLMASIGGGEERRKRVKAEEGVEIIDIDMRVQRQLENLRDDYTGLPIKYIDPLKSNLLQQVIKFTTPESRLKGTGLQLWAYNAGLQWWNDKRTDIFGQEVKTLPGDQGTAWPRVSDKRWEKMWKYNIHVQDVTSRDKLVIKGVPQTLEWDQYIERKKLAQELFRDRFDKYFEETTPAVLGRKATTEITEGEYKTNRVDKDIRDIWSKTKSDVNKYMFVWDKYIKKDPALFNFLMEEGLLPDFYKPEIKDDLGYNIIFPYDKLEKFNDEIMEGFIPRVKEYLKGKSKADIEKLKSGVNEKTGKSYLEDDIDYYYGIEKDYVNKDVKDELMIW